MRSTCFPRTRTIASRSISRPASRASTYHRTITRPGPASSGWRARRRTASTGAKPTAPSRPVGQRVGPGEGVAFLPDELHSIHIHGDAPVRNFHMYGLALDQLAEREYWSKKEQVWKVFPAQDDIIDRRWAEPWRRILGRRTQGVDPGRRRAGLFDLREQGQFSECHLFHARCLPLSRLELDVARLVPRKGTPLVLMDGGEGEDLARRGGERLAAWAIAM